MNIFPSDFQHSLTGFGGDASKNQAQHRAALTKTPVVLVHGNATNSADPKYGMLTMKSFLTSIGYNECEIWAMDYLGENNTTHLMPHPHRDRIDDVRNFIDQVKAYLGVERLDFIAHSLGCGMVNGYLRGLRSDGEWNNSNQRYDSAGTVVCLAGAIHGLGQFGPGEFQTGSSFEIASHRFQGIVDETPFGQNDESKQQVPPGQSNWKGVTSLDDSSVVAVAVIAQGDFVDIQYPGTGHMDGADANQIFNLGSGTVGHEKIVKDSTVFDAFKTYLNRTPPRPPVSITVDKDSGNYAANLSVTVSLTPPETIASYTASRVTKNMQGGFLETTVLESRSGTLTNGQSLSFDVDGEWDLVVSADRAEPVECVYGVNVVLPEVTILTNNDVPFQQQLDVTASATKGALFHSLDGQRWNTGAIVTITATSKVWFIALDPNGFASPAVSRSFEMRPLPQVTATLTEHYLAHRLSLDQYLQLGQRVGFMASVTLYFINDQWVLNPNTPQISHEAPTLHLSTEGGTHTSPLALTIAARHQSDAAPSIYYTLDGSMPTEASPSFTSSGRIRLDTPGQKMLKCRARDTSGNWSDVETKTFTMDIKPARPVIASDKASGLYAHGFDATLWVSDDTDPQVVAYYTQDGSDPSNPRNPHRQAFSGSKTFAFKTPGRHAVFCYAKNSSGAEILQPFAWDIEDDTAPETSISPALGGTYIGSITVQLSPSEDCAWTKYTVDQSEPSATHGHMYAGPIVITQSTVLKFRSMDQRGHLEPVKMAAFTISRPPEKMIFAAQSDAGGHIKANADGTGAFIGTSPQHAIGASRDGKDNRTILHFDTSSLPDNAIVDRAYLEVQLHTAMGNPFAEGRKIEVDVQQGYLSTSRALDCTAWGAVSTAHHAAMIEPSTQGVARSSDFSPDGLKAINKTGATQVRLRMNRPLEAPGNCVFLQEGSMRLVVGYSTADH